MDILRFFRGDCDRLLMELLRLLKEWSRTPLKAWTCYRSQVNHLCLRIKLICEYSKRLAVRLDPGRLIGAV